MIYDILLDRSCKSEALEIVGAGLLRAAEINS